MDLFNVYKKLTDIYNLLKKFVFKMGTKPQN